MTTAKLIVVCSALVLWLVEVQSQDCSQYTKNDCMFKHISGCDPGSCTKDSGATTAAPPDDSTGDTGKKGGGCFHGDEMVITEAGPLKMSELAVRPSIKVLSRGDDGRLAFSPVFYWLHATADLEQTFLVFNTEHGHELALTKDHLIYKTDCRGGSDQVVFADRIQPGHCVHVERNGRFVESRITERRDEIKRGVYAPITENGNVVVNGVLASCFTSLENEALQKIMYRYMDFVRRAVSALTSSSSLVNLFYSTPFAETMAVPEVAYSFWDLSKNFVGH